MKITMGIRSYFIFTLVAGALLFTGHPPPVLAQGLQIEEIVVTARKRSETLQEVPIAVSVFTEQQIQDFGIERPVDFIRLTPNVHIVDAANVGDTQVSIRGIVSTRDAESTFALVEDGVLVTNPNAFNRELLDVQQIEILKGPQGALYGRNAVAGAILFTTKEPSNEVEGHIKVGYGNNSSSKVSAVVSGPLVEDKLLGRIAASYRDTDGFYDNIFSGGAGAVDYLEDKSFKGRLIWNVNEDTKVDFRAGYSEVKGGAINFNAVFAVPGFVNAFGSDTFFADVNEHEFRFINNVPGENKQETTNFAVKADWELESSSLTAILSYNKLDEYLLSDGTSATFYGYELTPTCQGDRATLNSFARPDLFGGVAQPFLVLPPGADFAGVYPPYTSTGCDGYQYQERNQEDTSLEVRLTSPQDQKYRWIAGLYATKIDREVVVAYGADQGLGFERTPYVPPSGSNPTDLLFWDDFDTDVFAAFGQLEFDLNDSVELALALRYDREDRKVSNKVPNVMTSGLNINSAGQPINPAFLGGGAPPDRDRTFDQLQPKISLNWQTSENASLYASWGIGFRSGGFNSIGSAATIDGAFNQTFGAGLSISDEYEKEVSSTFELGAKTQWLDRRLQVNAAVFNTDVDDNQFFEFFAGPFGLLRVVTTIDEINIKGLEIDFNALLSEQFSVFGGFGYLDTEIKENLNRPLSVGNEVPQAPKETANLGIQFRTPLFGDTELVAILDWSYVGDTWFHTLQNNNVPSIWNLFFQTTAFNADLAKTKRESFDTINARVNIESERWTLSFWGRNIGDTTYLEEVIPAPEFGGSFIHPGALAAYGAELTFRF